MAIGSGEQELVDGLHGDDPGALAALFDLYDAGGRRARRAGRHRPVPDSPGLGPG